jgi:fumarate reductase flavoprotein subunit
MVEGIGGATQNIDAVGLYSHSSRCPLDPELEMLVPFLSMVPWVGMSGERFVDESAVNDLRTSEKIVAGGGAAWMAFDLDVAFDDSLCGSESADAVYYAPDELVELGFARRADNLTDLAAAIGVDADAFAASILDYNEATAGLHEDAYRADMRGARPVIRAPMYAMPVAVSPAKMFGGVEVDLQGRVLAVDGHVIRGLYASGELTGMAGGSLVGDAGFTGSLSAVVLGGRVAGAHAATDPILPIYK